MSGRIKSFLGLMQPRFFNKLPVVKALPNDVKLSY